MKLMKIGSLLASAALAVALVSLAGGYGRTTSAAPALATGKFGVVLTDGQFVDIDILGPVPDNPTVTLSRSGFTFTETHVVIKKKGVNNGVKIKAKAQAKTNLLTGGDDLTVTVTGLTDVNIPSDTQD
jgi:hypothetical protein